MTGTSEHTWVAAGVVVRGRQLGRRIGYPTANVEHHVGTILPSDGVYAGLVHLADGMTRAAAISVGANPTFDAVDRTLEAHLLDFDEDIYGMRVEVVSLRRLRGMTKFAGATELIESIGRDVDRTRDLVAHLVQAPLPR